ncbi:DUF6318 family protein [uncultured Kocuria sp.]|uniref:DUF6318 family protein n=1 Tax=uncultured Kocuria sp. TaxID=259305 RepID=UPI002634E586|nr:DUF6318 family protein [uncultured Kocuria sp.]
MVRSNPVGTAVGGLVLAALLLTGCGSDDDGAAASPSSATPSVSADSATSAAPSPEGTPADYVPASLAGPAQNVPKPVMPELAREESREGAQAFLDYWSDAMWYAYQTGDTSYAREITSDACEACMDELDELGAVYEEGSWAIGGRESVEISQAELFRAADGIYKPVVVYKRESGQLVSDAEIEVDAPGEPGDKSILYMDFADGSWIYITLAPIPGGQ